MKRLFRLLAILAAAILAGGTMAAEPPLKLGVGLFQPDREKNDATYRPLAATWRPGSTARSNCAPSIAGKVSPSRWPTAKPTSP